MRRPAALEESALAASFIRWRRSSKASSARSIRASSLNLTRSVTCQTASMYTPFSDRWNLPWSLHLLLHVAQSERLVRALLPPLQQLQEATPRPKPANLL